MRTIQMRQSSAHEWVDFRSVPANEAESTANSVLETLRPVHPDAEVRVV